MGTQTSNGGAIAYIPGKDGAPADSLGAVRIKRTDESVRAAFQRAGISVPSRAKIMTLSGEDLAAYGGARNFGREADVNDFLGGRSNLGRRLVQEQTRGAGANIARPVREGTRAADNARNAAAKTERARAEKKQIANERKRIGRQQMGARAKAKALKTLDARNAALTDIIARQRARG